MEDEGLEARAEVQALGSRSSSLLPPALWKDTKGHEVVGELAILCTHSVTAFCCSDGTVKDNPVTFRGTLTPYCSDIFRAEKDFFITTSRHCTLSQS